MNINIQERLIEHNQIKDISIIHFFGRHDDVIVILY